MYRLYIDETGNPDLESSLDPNHRYLSLTGIIISLDLIRRDATPRLNRLKEDILDFDPDDMPVMHRKDVLKKEKPFDVLQDRGVEARFNDHLIRLIRDVDYRVITAVIDKEEHLRRYQVWQQDPYHYCLEVLIERYSMSLNRRGLRGDVVGEARGRNEDRRLKECYRNYYQSGTSELSATDIQRALTSKELKIKAKSKNITGLQMADMIAYPSCRYLRSQYAGAEFRPSFSDHIIKILVREKYDRSPWGRIEGWGTKWLP